MIRFLGKLGPVVSSPAQRCVALARLISPDFSVCHEFLEMNFGDWEGQAWDKIPRKQIDAWADDPQGFTVPGGESYLDLRRRVQLGIEAWTQQDTVIIAHKGVMRSCLDIYCAMSFNDAGLVDIPFLSVLKIDMKTPTAPSAFKVITLEDIAMQ